MALRISHLKYLSKYNSWFIFSSPYYISMSNIAAIHPLTDLSHLVTLWKSNSNPMEAVLDLASNWNIHCWVRYLFPTVTDELNFIQVVVGVNFRDIGAGRNVCNFSWNQYFLENGFFSRNYTRLFFLYIQINVSKKIKSLILDFIKLFPMILLI